MDPNANFSANSQNNYLYQLARTVALNCPITQTPEGFNNRIPQPRPNALFGGQNFEEYKMGENIPYSEFANIQNIQRENEMEEEEEEEEEGDDVSVCDYETFLQKIKEQVARPENQKDGVRILELDGLKIGMFYDEVNNEIEQYKDTLKSLTLEDCGLVSLEYFPNLPNLEVLDLSFNRIKGDQLSFIVKLENLRDISLRGNPLKDYSDLLALTELKELVQMDLAECVLAEKYDYKRQKIFRIFPNLQILDNQDCDVLEISIPSQEEYEDDQFVDEDENESNDEWQSDDSEDDS